MDLTKAVFLCGVDLYSGFTTNRSPKEYLEDRLFSQKGGWNDNDLLCIIEIFFATVDNKPILRVAVEAFYETYGSTQLTIHKPLYEVLAAILMFLRPKLTLKSVKTVILQIGRDIVARFLYFLCNHKVLESVLEPRWLRMYERSYLNDHFYREFKYVVDQFQNLAEKLMGSSAFLPKQVSKSAESTAELIEEVTHELEEPKDAEVEEPKSIKSLSVRIAEIDLNTPKKKSSEGVVVPFQPSVTQTSLVSSEKSVKMKPKASTYKLKPQNSWPTVQKPEGSVKCRREVDNAASLLRAEAHIKKMVQSKTKMSRSAREYEMWLREQREAQEIDEEAKKQKKHLEGLLAREEAFLAYQAVQKEKSQIGEEVKKESEELKQQAEEWRQEEEVRMRELVEQVMAGKDKLRQIKTDLHAAKTKEARAVLEETRRLLELSLKQAQEEMSQKMDEIMQIRAMEQMHTAVKPAKPADLTECHHWGFLGEMSLAEARERLFLIKYKAEEEKKLLREQSRREKEGRERRMDNIKTMLEWFQEDLSRREKMSARPPVPKTIHNPELDELSKRLEERRNVRKAILAKSPYPSRGDTPTSDTPSDAKGIPKSFSFPVTKKPATVPKRPIMSDPCLYRSLRAARSEEEKKRKQSGGGGSETATSHLLKPSTRASLDYDEPDPKNPMIEGPKSRLK